MGKLWEMVWSRSLRITPAERCGSWGVYTPTSEDHWLMAAFLSTTWGQCSFWQVEMGVERALSTEMQTLVLGVNRSTQAGQQNMDRAVTVSVIPAISETANLPKTINFTSKTYLSSIHFSIFYLPPGPMSIISLLSELKPASGFPTSTFKSQIIFKIN